MKPFLFVLSHDYNGKITVSEYVRFEGKWSNKVSYPDRRLLDVPVAVERRRHAR